MTTNSHKGNYKMATARNKATENTTDMDEAAEIAALEAALNGESDEEVMINDEDFADIDDEALEAALQADEAKENAYGSQKSEVDVASEEEIAAEADAPKKAKKSAGNYRGPASGATRDAELFAKEVSSIFGDDVALDSNVGAMSADDFTELMKSVTQIKVREKIINLAQHVMNGRKLNGYTQMAVDVLVKAQLDGCKPVTITDLKAAYQAKGYKPGTVNAQAGQLMALFRVMKMAEGGTRSVLEPNASSVLLDVLASS
jgi:hypothetical protein